MTTEHDDEDFKLSIDVYPGGLSRTNLGPLLVSIAQGGGKGILVLPGRDENVKSLQLLLLDTDQEEAEDILTLVLHTLEHGKIPDGPKDFDGLEEGTWLRSSENGFYRRDDQYGGWFDGVRTRYITDLPGGQTYHVLKSGPELGYEGARALPVGAVILDFDGDPLIHVDERGWAYPWAMSEPGELVQFSRKTDDYYAVLED